MNLDYERMRFISELTSVLIPALLDRDRYVERVRSVVRTNLAKAPGPAGQALRNRYQAALSTTVSKLIKQLMAALGDDFGVVVGRISGLTGEPLGW